MSKDKDTISEMIASRKDEAMAAISEARGAMSTQFALLPPGIVERLGRARCFVRDYTVDPKVILGQHDETMTRLSETLKSIASFESAYGELASYLRPDYLAGDRQSSQREDYHNPEVMRVALGLVEELVRRSHAILLVTQ